jgi:hypothetical protein
LLSEQKKTYHLRSKEPESCCVSVLGRTIVKTRQFQVLDGLIEQQIVCHPTSLLINSDLTTHMFRQRTQELLYESRKMSEKFKEPEFSFTPMKKSEEEEKQRLEIKEMKTKLKEFHKLMMEYMKEHELETDPIMKMLCDDIYVANKTIGTRLGNMFTCARQTSQGRQQIYTCSAVKEDDLENDLDNELESSALWHATTRLMKNSNKRMDNEEIVDYDIQTTNNLSPYISDTVMTVMREVSGMGLTK